MSARCASRSSTTMPGQAVRRRLTRPGASMTGIEGDRSHRMAGGNDMKIVDLKARCVAIPLDCQLRHNTGVHPGYFLRTVLELITDEGVVGLGEVGGGDQRGALLK